MRYTIASSELRAMDVDERFVSRKYDKAVHHAFRKVMGLIRGARDERDLRAFKSLRLEKLKGDRLETFSLRLTQAMRLIIRFVTDPNGQTIVVIEIVDYHK